MSPSRPETAVAIAPLAGDGAVDAGKPLTAERIDWAELSLVMLTSTLVGFTVALTYPLLAVQMTQHGATALEVGINSAAGGLGIFIVGPFINRLVARFGVAGCFRLGMMTAALCLVLFSVHYDLVLWFALRLAYACAGALMFVLSESSVTAITPLRLRGRVIGVYATLFCIGFAGGPAILVLVGTAGPLPFIAAAALFVLGLLPTLGLARLNDRFPPSHAGSRGALRMTWNASPVAIVAIFVYALAEGAHFAFLPVWAIAGGAAPDLAAGMVGVWLAGNIVFQIPLGWLGDRLPRPRLIAACAVIAALATAALPFAGPLGPYVLWPLLLVSGGFMGGLYTLALVLVGEHFAGAELTRANTAFIMTFQLGILSGPPTVGAVMHLVGPQGFTIALLPPLLALAAFVFASRRLTALPSPL